MSGWVGILLRKWVELENTLGQFMIAVWICIILFSLLQCFLGYKIRKIWTAVEAVILFGTIGALVAVRYELSGVLVAAVAAGAGLAGGLLGYFLWIIGGFIRVLLFVFIASFSFFMYFGQVTLEDFINGIPAEIVAGLIVSLALGLIGGIQQIAFNKPFMIGYTAVSGALVTVFSLSKLIPAIMETWFVPVIIGAVIALLGILVQVLLEKASKKQLEEGAAWEKPASEAKEAQSENVLDDAAKVLSFGVPAAKAETAAAMEAADSQEAAVIQNPVAGTEAPMAVQETEQAATQENLQPPTQENLQPPTQETVQMAAPETISESEDAQPQRNLCPKCGAEYKPGAKFCMKCGQKL